MATAGQPERVEGYEPFFGLSEAPFSLTPDPRFLFASASLSAALAQLAHALERREPLVVVTGEIGTGKTLLCRAVLDRIQRKTFLSVISDPLLERDDLLKQLLEDFGVIAKDRTRLTETSRHDLIQTLQAFLRSLAAIQAHAVVVVDEAQHLQPEVLEQIRLLSNIDDERGTLLQIILVGQPELETLLARPELRQLQQRVSRRFRLEPLNSDEVRQYIEHRLALARHGKPPSAAPGAAELARALAEWAEPNAGVEFTPDAIQAVSQLSGGLPRVVNLLCDRSLEEAHASGLRVIDPALIHTAARALGVGEHASPATMAATVDATAPNLRPLADESFWNATPSEPVMPEQAIRADDQPVPAGLSARTLPSAVPRYAIYIAGSLALAAVAIWIGVRAARSPVAPATASAKPPSAATLVFSDRPEPAKEAVTPPVPEAAATTGTPARPEATPRAPSAPTTPAAPPAPAAAAPATAAGRFDIVVASFRTNSPATAVAAQVAALGLPMRRRVSDGWQQVLSGPFASRADAEKAQQRLGRAGLSGTHIVATAR